MKMIKLICITLLIPCLGISQMINKIITKSETERIERVLASDEMEGRRTFSPSIDKAAAFIAKEFESAGLKSIKGDNNFLQSFTINRPKFISLSATIDGAAIDNKQVVVVTVEPEINITETTGYTLAKIAAGENLNQAAAKLIGANQKMIVLVDEAHTQNFSRLIRFKNNLASNQATIVFILTNTQPVKFNIQASHQIESMKLANVVAMIPGKTLPNEYVIFSGHYDHLGVNAKNMVNGDSIYNGANDDAAGTTAMIMLSKYYKALNNNARTILFAAFTAEEVGGYGAQYFSKQLDPTKVVAMFNIEMIGTESKWGKNSAYITGFDKTSMGAILQKNLEQSNFKFYPDPYTEQNLFYRSDNATLARLDVAAHTISTSKMDSEPNYHKASDQIETLDLDNMNEIIKAIALSAGSIVAGKDTPTRVDTTQLK
ncbi:MAG: M28 family peptidase [Chitinophagia bacterium]